MTDWPEGSAGYAAWRAAQAEHLLLPADHALTAFLTGLDPATIRPRPNLSPVEARMHSQATRPQAARAVRGEGAL